MPTNPRFFLLFIPMALFACGDESPPGGHRGAVPNTNHEISPGELECMRAGCDPDEGLDASDPEGPEGKFDNPRRLEDNAGIGIDPADEADAGTIAEHEPGTEDEATSNAQSPPADADHEERERPDNDQGLPEDEAASGDDGADRDGAAGRQGDGPEDDQDDDDARAGAEQAGTPADEAAASRETEEEDGVEEEGDDEDAEICRPRCRISRECPSSRPICVLGYCFAREELPQSA